MNTHAKIVVGDKNYNMTPAYIAGAKAFRADQQTWDNPYNEDMQQMSYEDWEAGFDNEDAGEHKRFGKDLIEECEPGATYDEDPDLERDEYGYLIQE